MREEFDKWIASLNEFDLNYLEKEYIEECGLSGASYKDMDIWLYNLWGKGLNTIKV
jgi:hypothetical protein